MMQYQKSKPWFRWAQEHVIGHKNLQEIFILSGKLIAGGSVHNNANRCLVLKTGWKYERG